MILFHFSRPLLSSVGVLWSFATLSQDLVTGPVSVVVKHWSFDQRVAASNFHTSTTFFSWIIFAYGVFFLVFFALCLYCCCFFCSLLHACSVYLFVYLFYLLFGLFFCASCLFCLFICFTTELIELWSISLFNIVFERKGRESGAGSGSTFSSIVFLLA